MAGSRRDKHQGAKDFIQRWCDRGKLKVEDVRWDRASDPGRQYNCFGFVIGRLRWCQPPIVVNGKRRNPTDYWPEGITTNTSIEAFVEAANSEGFQECPTGEWNENFETIVLYFTETDREFTHAARHKSPGLWESKLGPLSDFEHPLDGVDNIHYGSGRVYMRRAKQIPAVRIG
jgi:hypothetical protein